MDKRVAGLVQSGANKSGNSCALAGSVTRRVYTIFCGKPAGSRTRLEHYSTDLLSPSGTSRNGPVDCTLTLFPFRGELSTFADLWTIHGGADLAGRGECG